MNEPGPENGGGSLLLADDDLTCPADHGNPPDREGYKVRCSPNGEMALICERRPPRIGPARHSVAGPGRVPNLPAPRRGAEESGIPVMFLGGLDEAEDKVKGFAAGGVDDVTKPVSKRGIVGPGGNAFVPQTHAGAARCKMRDWHRGWQPDRAKEALRRAHDELEKRVKERTAELASAQSSSRSVSRKLSSLKATGERKDLPPGGNETPG